MKSLATIGLSVGLVLLTACGLSGCKKSEQDPALVVAALAKDQALLSHLGRAIADRANENAIFNKELFPSGAPGEWEQDVTGGMPISLENPFTKEMKEVLYAESYNGPLWERVLLASPWAYDGRRAVAYSDGSADILTKEEITEHLKEAGEGAYPAEFVKGLLEGM